MKTSILIFGLLLTFLTFPACQKSKINTAEDLDVSLSKIYDGSKFPGFSVAVIKNDEVAFQKSYGFANVSAKTAFTNQTTQNIGSVSKLMISISLMQCVEKGLFTLETNINDILPFKVTNPNSPNDPIKIKHLATHTSGIVDDAATYQADYAILKGEDVTTPIAKLLLETYKAKQNGDVMKLGDFVQNYLTPTGKLYKASNFSNNKPGENYAYSNIAASLAGYIVEVKTKISFDVYTKTNIFTPLGMKNTAWNIADLDKKNVAIQYWTKSQPLPFYTSSSYPDGNLNSSIEDMSIFMVAMMKGFSGNSTFLKADTWKLMYDKKLSPLPTNMNAKEDNSGVFWVWFKNGRVGHTGSNPGIFTFLAFTPDKKTGFYFSGNVDLEEGDDSKALSETQQKIITAIKEFEAK